MKLFSKISLFLFLFLPLRAHPQNRIDYNKQKLFLSGSNLAWINFAHDIGPGITDFTRLEQSFKAISANGGNAMRWWLHTNGAESPAFDSNGFVTSPGAGTIVDLKQALDLAWKNNTGLILCLWSFDMLRISFGAAITDRAMKMLTNDAALDAYINKSLIPMVEAVKGHPGIISWEVFNEAEGMSDEFGWAEEYHVPMARIQRFVNRVAGAIHRTDSTAKVTNGAWCFKVQSDVTFSASVAAGVNSDSIRISQNIAGSKDALPEAVVSDTSKAIAAQKMAALNYNYYSDARLIASGGDFLGYLDFYTVHYYDWAGTALSPFHHTCKEWNLDKPLVVAEFFLQDTFGKAYQDMWSILYNSGYAGALNWDMNTPLQLARAKEVMKSFYNEHPNDVAIIKQGGKILVFRATPSSVEIGDTTELSWEATPGAIITYNGVLYPSKGSVKIIPEKTTVYKIYSKGEISDSAEVKVIVIPSGRVLSFSAAPSKIGRGDTAVIVWRASRGSTVKIDGSEVSIADTLKVTPLETTTYLFQFSGEENNTKSVSIIVVSPDSVSRASFRPVTVSSSEIGAGHDKSVYLVDDNSNTSWKSGASFPQWVVIDLLQKTDLKQFVLGWNAEYSTSYRIGISDNGTDWKLIKNITAGKGGTETIGGLSATARYIKFMFDKGISATGVSLNDIGVYGLPAAGSGVSEDYSVIPQGYVLRQNYPNPFNPSTTIEYELPAASKVTLRVYNMLGQLVAELDNAYRTAGTHSTVFKAYNLSSGVYMYRLSAGGCLISKKLILLK